MKKLAPGDLVLLRRKHGIELSLVAQGPSADDPDWFRGALKDGKVRRFPTSLVVHGPFQTAHPAGEEPAARLTREEASLDARAANVDLRLLHECALAERRPYTVAELADLLLDDADGEGRAALFLALCSDESRFEEEDGHFVPMTPEAIEARERERAERAREEEEKKERAEAQRERKRIERETLEPELKRLATGRIAPGELSEITRTWLRGLREFVIEGPPPGNGDLSYGGDPIRIRDEGHAVQLLTRAGLWEPDREDAHALRAEIGRPYTEEVIAAARDLTSEVRVEEQDLTSIHTFTVDGPSTRDLDDALSLERVEEGMRVRVHIADVARWLPKDSVLDRWGREVSESVYLPEITHHLYPEDMVSRVSLDPDVERGAVTMSLLVTPDGEVRETTFARTRVRSDERLDYDELDRRVAEDAAWAERARVIDWLQARRERMGARITLLPDLEIQISGSRISTSVSPTDTPSHKLVSELMILYNEQVGLFLSKHGVPAIFKTQPPDPTPPEYPDPEDPLYFPKIVRLLRPSVSGLDAAPHAFIGASAYCQATSPIRRYQDLIHQRQLLSVLDGTEPPHPREELELLYPVLEQRGIEVRRVERRRRRYWVLKRLHKLRGERIHGIVSQIRPGGRPVVFFPDFLIETGLLLPQDFAVEPGDDVYVTPQKVDPIRGGFWAKPAG